MRLTTIMLTRPVALSAAGLLSAGLAGLAVYLALRHPAGQLRRIRHSTSRFAVITGPLARLLGGRPDAPSLARRTALSTVCGMAVGLVAARGLGFDMIWLVVPAVAVTGVLALGWLEPRSARRRNQRLIMEGPQALELLAACLAAGLPARTACSAVVQSFDGPVADDLGQVLSLMELGVADVDAWRILDDHPQLGLAAADLARSVESGTSMVEGLQHHAAAAREARRGALQVRARAVGVRTIRF